MNLKYSYWYFTSAIPSHICDQISHHAFSFKNQLATIGDIKKIKNLQDEKKVKKTRNSNVVFLDDRWIYNEIHPWIVEANKLAGWNFEWNITEHVQFTIYDKGQFYGWHEDSWSKPYDHTHGAYSGKIRKLSASIILSDPSEYTGGELEFEVSRSRLDKPPHFKVCNEIKEKGSIVIFPSFIKHRVKPVTKGRRLSLVAWNLGNPFK